MNAAANHSLFRSALFLLALLPAQLLVESSIAYFLPRVQSQRVILVNGNLELDPNVNYLLADVPLHPFTLYLFYVTAIAFMLGLFLLVIEAIRRLMRRRNQTI